MITIRMTADILSFVFENKNLRFQGVKDNASFFKLVSVELSLRFRN